MFAHIRRHQRWLFLVIGGLTIISFVYFLDPTTGRRGGGRSIFSGGSSAVGSINGRAISAEEYAQAECDARLQYLFSAGRWPEEDENSRQFFDLEPRARQRLFFVEKLSDLNIEVNNEAVADWIAHAHTFADRNTGAFKLEAYQEFVTTVLPRGRVTENEFRTFVRHQAGIEQMFALAALSGDLVTPREVEAIYRQENEQLATEAAFFPASNHLAGVQVTPAALGQFYSNNMAAYRIPERVQVGYVKFEMTNHLAEADEQLAKITNLTERLEAFYQQRGPDFFKDADGRSMSH